MSIMNIEIIESVVDHEHRVSAGIVVGESDTDVLIAHTFTTGSSEFSTVALLQKEDIKERTVIKEIYI